MGEAPNFSPAGRRDKWVCGPTLQSTRSWLLAADLGDGCWLKIDLNGMWYVQVLFSYYSTYKCRFWVWYQREPIGRWDLPIFPQRGPLPWIHLYAQLQKWWRWSPLLWNKGPASYLHIALLTMSKNCPFTSSWLGRIHSQSKIFFSFFIF